MNLKGFTLAWLNKKGGLNIATVTEFRKELTALSTWVKQSAGLKSFRLDEVPHKIPRPVVLWTTPSRGRLENLSNYIYKQSIRQYGKLFAANLDQLIEMQTKLSLSLADMRGIVPIIENGVTIGKIKQAEIIFENSESLDVDFNITYECTYGRSRPEAPPPATRVIQVIEANDKGVIIRAW